jgi:hypothetical protein
MVYNEATMAANDFKDLKGMKLPGVQADGNFPSSHSKLIFENGKARLNPAWSKDQAVLRDAAKVQARDNLQRIQDGQSRAKPINYGKPTLPKGQMDFFKGKLPGLFGYPGLIMQFKEYLEQQKDPNTTIDGTPLQTKINDKQQLMTLASLRLPQ